MRVTLPRLLLNDALTQINKIVGARNSLPALSCTKVTVTDAGAVVMQASNLDQWVTAHIDSTYTRDIDPGEVLVPTRQLKKLIKGAEYITIERRTVTRNDTEVERLGLVIDGASMDLRMYPEEDFPEFPEVTRKHTPIDSDTILSVAYAASTDVSRPVLNGVLFEKDGQCAATDSYRLMVGTAGEGFPIRKDDNALVPARPLVIVAKYDDMSIAFDGKYAELAGAQTKGPKRKPRTVRYSVVTSTIDGQFPSWAKLLPDTHDVRAIIEDPDELRGALDGVKALAVNQSNTPVSCTWSPTHLTMTCGTREIGEGVWEVNAHLDEGDEVTIAFNPAYMRDMVDAFGDRQISVELRDALKPAVFRAGDLVGLLMPMRVN